jgi:4-carboxymuconolactone decarboxylase
MTESAPPSSGPAPGTSDAASVARGEEVMDLVYWPGFKDNLPTQRSPMLNYTLRQLYAEAWAAEGMSIRDRRLLILGVSASLGRADLIEVQALAALRRRELTAAELRAAVVHLHYFVGWGNGTMVDRGVESAISAFTAMSAETV